MKGLIFFLFLSDLFPGGGGLIPTTRLDVFKLFSYSKCQRLLLYCLMQCTSIAAELAGGHVIAGYLEHRDLPPAERRILRTCVAAR